MKKLLKKYNKILEKYVTVCEEMAKELKAPVS